LETSLFVAAKGTIKPDTLHFLFTYEAEPIERLRELMFRGSSNVTVFEMLPKAGEDVGKSTKWVLFGNLKRYGVQILTNSKVISIHKGAVTFESEKKINKMNFNSVILASGSRPVTRISSQIKELGIPHSIIGDCIAPGKINDAIHGGFMAALSI